MDFDLDEAIKYYSDRGAPGDQNELTALLKEAQRETGGILSKEIILKVGEAYNLKESFLLALIKRIPSLKIDNTHILEICCGPNCPKRADIPALVKKLYGDEHEGFRVKLTGCMRLCGKGPNIKWDGVLYSGADEKLIRKLVEGKD